MMTSSNGSIFRVTGHLCGEFAGPAQRAVTRSFVVFFDLRLNKRLSKQSWGWWFGTLSRPLLRHCYGYFGWPIFDVLPGYIRQAFSEHSLLRIPTVVFLWGKIVVEKIPKRGPRLACNIFTSSYENILLPYENALCMSPEWRSLLYLYLNKCKILVVNWSIISCKKKKCHMLHDDVIKWKHFPRCWSFVRGIHRWPVRLW